MNELKKDGIIYLKADIDNIVTLTLDEAIKIVKDKTPFAINGQFYRATVFGLEGFEPCEFCNLDSLCKKPVSGICTDLEFFTGKPIILKLMNDKPYDITEQLGYYL